MTDSKTPDWADVAARALDAMPPEGLQLRSHRIAFISQALLSAYERGKAEREWQPIETAPKDGKLYEVSYSGEVRVDGAVRRPFLTDRGYLRVSIGGRTESLHRLVANHFIPNPLGRKEVNHIDGDKANNHASNLEWCTRSENMKHAYANGLHPGVVLKGEDSPNWKRNGRRHPQSMAVRAVFPDGTTKDYESQSLAALDGFRPNKISQCINGQSRSHGGATWMPLPVPPAIRQLLEVKG